MDATLTNGRRYVIDYGNHYRLYAHMYGALEIERIADGATLFVQGDDAAEIGTRLDEYRNAAMNAHHAYMRDGVVNAVWSQRDTVDVLCDEYSEVLLLVA